MHVPEGVTVSTSPWAPDYDLEETDYDLESLMEYDTTTESAPIDSLDSALEPSSYDIRAEIKQLRQENDEKDERLWRLQQAVMALQQESAR